MSASAPEEQPHPGAGLDVQRPTSHICVDWQMAQALPFAPHV